MDRRSEVRSVRVDDALWGEIERAADRRGVSKSEMVRAGMMWVIAEDNDGVGHHLHKERLFSRVSELEDRIEGRSKGLRDLMDELQGLRMEIRGLP